MVWPEEYAQLCNQIYYRADDGVRTFCDEPAVETIGRDTLNSQQFRYCKYHWYDFRRALNEEIFVNPHWQSFHDHIINSHAARWLSHVLWLKSEERKRAAEGQKAESAHREFLGRGVRSVVYFIQAGDDGPIKIGYATDVKSRLDALQTSNHAVLHLRAVQPGDRTIERAYHNIFTEHRLTGEWFTPVPKLLATIDAINRQSTSDTAA